MSGSLDLGTLFGTVDLITAPFDVKYAAVVRKFTVLGGEADKASVGTAKLDKSFAGLGASSSEAAVGLTRADMALREASVLASKAAVSTTQAGLAQSKLTQSSLRQTAAQARLNALQETGKASTAQLAGAQASLIAANDRVALSQERVQRSTLLGARTADRMGAAWSSIPAPVKAGALAFGVAAVEAVKAASGYQKLTVNLVTGAGELQQNLSMVSSGMLSMAGAVGDSASTLAKAMFLVESAGYHGAAALTVLKIAAEGAKVDNADLTTVVDALTSAMNAYHEPASNAAKVTNTLIASAAVGKMHLQDLSSALGTVLPSAAALRVPLDQVGAALATMTMQGTDSARAATYLRFSFAALANPTSKAQAAMKAVGLTSEQVANTMTHGGLPAVFELLQTAVGKKFPAGSARYLAALANMVGGTRGLQAVLELTGRNLGTMNANLTSIQDRVKGAGNSVSDWSQVQKNLNVQFSQFVDGLQAAGIRIGEDLIPAATSLLHVLVDLEHAGGAVVGFFEHNAAAALALAAVLSATLLPKLIATIIVFAQFAATAIAARVAALGAAFAEASAGAAGFGAALEALNIDPVIAAITAVAAVTTGLVLWLHRAKDTYNQVAAAGHAYVASLNDQHTSAAQSTNDVAAMVAQLRALRAEHVSDAAGAKLLKQHIDDLSAAIAEQGGIAGTERGNVAALAAQYGMTAAAMDSFAKAHNIGSLNMQDFATAVAAAASPTMKLTGAEDALKGAVQGSDAAVQALSVALDSLVGNTISADQQQNAFASGLRQLKKDLDASHGSLSRLSATGTTARDSFDSLIGTVLQSAAANEKLKNGGDKARAVLEAQIAALKGLGSSSPYVIGEINKLTQALHDIPKNPHVKVTADTSQPQQALANLVATLRGVASHAWSAVVDVFTHTSSSSPQHHAAGGLISGAGSGTSDSIPALLSNGEFVMPADRTARYLPLLEAIRAGRIVDAALAAAVAPAITDPSALSGLLSSSRGTAVAAQQASDTAHAIYRQAAHDLNGLKRANSEAEAAAKRHAQALSNEAHKAHELAANMTGSTKAAAAAKHAAEEHARSLDAEARAASQAATKIAAADSKREQSATKTAQKAKQAWTAAASAAQQAAQAAENAAQQLVTSLQGQLDTLAQQVNDFTSSISAGLTGDDSLSTIWQSLTDAATNSATALASAQQTLTDAQNAVTGAGSSATADQIKALADAQAAYNTALSDYNRLTAAASTGGVQSSLDQVLASAQQFAGDLQTLIGEGATQTLISQLVAMGPQAGDALASQLVAAGPDSVAKLSATLDQIASYTKNAADQMAQTFFGGGVSAMEQFIAGLISQFPALSAALAPVLSQLQGLFAGASGSASAATGGPAHGLSSVDFGGVLPGFAGGVTNFVGGWAMVGENGPEVLRLPRGSSVYPRGSDGAAAMTATLHPDDRALLRAVAAQMEARPVQLLVDHNGRRVIGEVANDHRQFQRELGNRDYL